MEQEGQRSEPFVEPPRDRIPGISRQHVAAMQQSDADEVWTLAGMQHLVLRTIGRRSGKEHLVALPFWLDPSGDRIVVASFAGAPGHPAWYLNLLDRAANPEVLVRVQGRQFWAGAGVLSGDDRARTWEALTADRPHYRDYQSRTEREIPLVRLVERAGRLEGLIGVYHAEGSLLGELRYAANRALGRDHCSLCDLTHRGWRRRRDWDALCRGLAVPVALVHLDERSPDATRASEGRTPCVLADLGGELVLLLGPEELAACAGDVPEFERRLREAADGRRLDLG